MTCGLQSYQVQTLYEAIGYMIAALIDQLQTMPLTLSDNEQRQVRLYGKIHVLPNQEWDDNIQKIVKKIGDILKINARACTWYSI